MTDRTPGLRVVQPAGEVDTRATLDLVAHARRSLVEARTLPDIRRVMEAATVASDAAKRVAKLAEAQQMAAAVVEAANEAANEAASVRIEAQAKAGELLRSLDLDRGGRPAAGENRSQAATGLDELGVSKSESSRWQQVAAVPARVRDEYVEETRTARGEVSTAGLLRYSARAPAPAAGQRPVGVDHAAIAAEARKQVRRIYRELLSLPGYRPESLVSSLDNREKKNLLRALQQLSVWIEDVKGELAVHRVAEEEE